ncbi:Sperm-associated antigen 1 (HSD-3.8) (Infertility-related sperm protein Spag-1) [Durusdinium trenchii]|uniref:Sperm-associated antigen 1 (HSD-3.8) (Infertility-related sperm protein Spag-1) n=1 Tax=Durusdinium trenchii TaxID=1381693 RepID=A0ABP0Q3W7_9DINO
MSNSTPSEAQWHESFLEHLALQRKKRLRARALLALALISEPMERQWKEIFVDVAWTAWVQVVGDERRQREMCKAQQMYEKVLNDAHSAMGLTCLTVWSSRAILPFRFSSDTLLALLQKALPSVPPKDLEVVAESVPKELDGQTSFFQLMSKVRFLSSWLYPSAKQAIDIEEWQALRRQHCSWAKRCHSLLVLSLIAEPFQHFWREVFLDLAWSAWAGAVAGTRRRRSLCVAQAEFESEADRLSALCGNQVSPQDVASTALHNILVPDVEVQEQANEKFRGGDFFSAKCLYSGSLEMLERCCLHLDKADEVWEGIKNNMALCDLKRQEWARAVDTTTEILQRNNKNTKALYRRGVARIGQSKLREAREDLEAVVELEPENADARHKLAEILKQLRANRTAEKEQADKMRGFLRGERIDDTVPITEDGSVRKLHGNENAPLLASWIKRSWLQEASGVAGVVTAHVVMKTPAGKELLNTRKPPGSLSSELGPQMAAQPKAADRPAEPARWVMDDQWRSVFQAWNSAGKTLQLYELGKFEVARQCMGPSVEAAIAKCFQDWLPDSPEQRDMYKDVPEDVKQTGLRRQAIQILGLPEEFCMQEEKEPQATLQMEMELLESSEYTDLDGDGRYLLRTIKEGKGAATVSGLSTVQAHFRIAKLLLNYALKDTRLGLANGPNGLVLRADRTKEPMEFIVGEEAAAGEGDFVPPCIGQCLKLPAGGVTEGTHFEVILRDGVPIREMEKDIHSAFSDGRYAGLPDTSGPVSIRIEVEKVARACEGPKDPAWRGLESFQAERQRAEALEALEEGRHQMRALTRWRRVLRWFDEIFSCRKWRTQEGKPGDSMYDLQWDDDTEATSKPLKCTAPSRTAERPSLEQRTETAEQLPQTLEVEDALLQQLSPEELGEFAAAHSACAALTSGEVSARHARCAVQACKLTSVPAHVEVRGRSTLAWRLSEEGKSEEALAILKEAQALDPQNTALRDQAALLIQKDTQTKSVTTLEALKSLKQDLSDSLEAKDNAGLQMLLEELDSLPLTWEAASETKIGKEVGLCAKLSEPSAERVAELAKSIIARLHKLAKAERPLWVR